MDRERDRDRLVRGGRRDRRAHARRSLRSGRGRHRRVHDPDRRSRPGLVTVGHDHRHARHDVLDEMPRRELGPVLERADLELDRPAIGRPDREAGDLGEGDGIDRDDDAGGGRRPGSRDDHRHDRDEGERGDQDRQASGHVPPQGTAVPVLPGAWSGVPSAQRGQVSGPGS